MLVKGASPHPADTRPFNAALEVFNERREIYLTSGTVKVRRAFLPLPPGAVVPKGWLGDWAVAARHGITGHLDEYDDTFGQAWKGHWFGGVGQLPDGTGWPLEQCSYWLDGGVRLGYMLNDTALISKATNRLDMVVSGVLDGGESFIYWRPKSILDESVRSHPGDPQFNSWAHSGGGGRHGLRGLGQTTGFREVHAVRALPRDQHDGGGAALDGIHFHI
jgi:hypothetical protein